MQNRFKHLRHKFSAKANGDLEGTVITNSVMLLQVHLVTKHVPATLQ